MIEFKRNKKTGILEAWKNGKLVGPVITQGDETSAETKEKPNKKR